MHSMRRPHIPTYRHVPAPHLPPAAHHPISSLSSFRLLRVPQPHSTYAIRRHTRTPPSSSSKATKTPSHRRRRGKRAAMFEPVDVAKTHEILARFRPIAPKPQLPAGQLPAASSPALQLRSRRCRFRRQNRAQLPAKRQKTAAFFPFLNSAPPDRDLLALSLHPPTRKAQPPVERDLLQKLQEPRIIAPRPVRPVGSSISVGPINELSQSSAPAPAPAPPKRPDEVEDEVEAETLPAVVSDCRNRVRLVNSAYKELVGQPECMWLDSMGYGSDCRRFDLRPLSRRINGEVMLEFAGDSARPSPSLNGFSCRVKIEWACNGRKTFVDAPCDVIRVCCESDEYLFAWKFHIGEAYRTDHSVS